LEPVDHQLVAFVADDRVDGPHLADDGLHAAAELLQDGGNFVQLFGGEAARLRKNHDAIRPRWSAGQWAIIAAPLPPRNRWRVRAADRLRLSVCSNGETLECQCR